MNQHSSPMQRKAQIAGWACRSMAITIPILTILSWVLGTVPSELTRRFGQEAVQQLDSVQIVLVFLLSLLPALALARTLFLMASCFDCFAGTDWFGSAQPKALTRAGSWLVLSGILTFLVPTLIGFVVSLNTAEGARMLVISISSNGVLSVLFGLLIWMLGHFWSKANALAAENARFV